MSSKLVTGSGRTAKAEPQTCPEITENGRPYNDLIYCLYPGCYSRGFRQGLALEEHVMAAHSAPLVGTPPSDEDTPTPTSTVQDPFDRLEMYVESLRNMADFQKLVDEESTKGKDSLRKQIKRTRAIGWKWRCAKCSQTIELDCYGSACQFCGRK